MNAKASAGERKPAERIVFFDTLRGLTILSMVAFHTTYDLAYLYGYDMPWFTSTLFQDIWRASISWTFLILAGWMTQHSRNNLKRAVLYSIAALLVFLVTSIANVDTPVSFGIIYCMAFCTLSYGANTRYFKRVNPFIGLAICLSLFAITYKVPSGSYLFKGFSWLGFPGPGFASGDYYPPIPYFFLYASGIFLAIAYLTRSAKPNIYPDWMKKDFCHPLTIIGQHSLLVYLIHQPIVLILLNITLG